MQVGEVYENPVTGERMEVLESTEERLLIDFRIAAGGAVPMEHVHPFFAESFHLLEGELALRAGGRESVVRPGEEHVVAPGVSHAWWNAGDAEARVTLEITPPGRFSEMIATMFQLARDGETDAKGRPSLLQLALTGPAIRDAAYVTKPPMAVQRVLFALLGPIARRRGLTPLREYRHQAA